MLKSKCLTAIFCFLAVCLAFAQNPNISVSISPENPHAGENATLILMVDGREGLKVPNRMPSVDGITWLNRVGQSTRLMFVNGSLSGQTTTQISFIPEKKGPCTIPAFECTYQGKTVKIPPFSFTVSDAPAYDAKINENIELELIVEELKRRKTFYTGEIIPIQAVFAYRNAKLREIPEIIAEVTPDIKQNTRFSLENNFMSNGKMIVRFKSQIISFKEGTFKIQATAKGTMEYAIDFFNSKIRPYKVKSNEIEITIKNTPPVPPNTIPLNIKGENAKIRCDAVPKTGVKGEPITIKMTLSGKANYNNLYLGKLFLDGCTSYPPEIKSNSAFTTVLFTFTPTKPGTMKIDKTFAFFDVISGDYKTSSFKGEINIQDSAAVITATPSQPPAQTGVVRTEPQKNTVTWQKDELRYLHDAKQETVSVPVWKNKLILQLAIVFAGMFIALAILLIRSWRGIAARLSNADNAKNTKNSVLKALKKMPPQGIDEETLHALMDILANSLEGKDGISRESSDADILDCLQKQNPELAESLRTLSGNLWLPDSVKQTFNTAFYQKLLENLGKILTICLCCLATFTVSATENTNSSFRQEYDHGNYEKCIEILNSELATMGNSKSSPEILYQLGTCHANLNTPEHNARALAYLERAHRLNPRSADVLANLNLVRNRLGLPGKYPLDSFANCMLRVLSLLRPDELLTILASALALLFIALTLKKHPGKNVLICLAGAVILLSAATFIVQDFLIYNDNKAVIIEKTPVYRFPIKMEKEETSGEFLPGTIIEITAVREERILIQSDFGSGWISEDKILRY